MVLRFSASQWGQIQDHLVPKLLSPEQAAFAFMESAESRDDLILTCIEVRLLAGNELSHQSVYNIEVAESVQAEVIKRAHDLSSSLMELHSHVFDSGPSFSYSDWLGFEEFVPHVWFRLKQKPYAALVMSPAGIDALGWESDPRRPVEVSAVLIGDQVLAPSRISFERMRQDGIANV
ncbi:MAG: hypothetical protein U0R49_11540 [Fimbriimonadales bacterium]